jgi:uncharacterized protein
MNSTTPTLEREMPSPQIEYVHFHGFNSSKESSTGVALQTFLGEKLLRVEYDYINPDRAFSYLNGLLEDLLKTQRNLRLIGNSLGGFWANHFANKYGLKVVLINPCYRPSVLLQKYLGENQNHKSHEIRVMEQGHIDAFRQYEVLENQFIERIVIISEKDETIPPLENIKFFKDCATIITCPNEGHQFGDMTTLFTAVSSLK